jgi:hypothetical protein
MKKLKLNPANQQGFIPMMLSILGVIGLIIFFVYQRVVSVAG